MSAPAPHDGQNTPMFAYPVVDGKGVLRPAFTRGRPAIIAFLTTYDIVSQAQARYLSTFDRHHRSDIAVAAVILESEDNRPLVMMFRDTLGLRYPVAMGDASAISGKGPFGDVPVPTTVFLDVNGHIVSKRSGLITDSDMEDTLGIAR